MPRRKNLDRPIEKKLSLPGSLVEEVEARLHDPVRGHVEYGAFAKLVTSLLNDWLTRATKTEP